MTDTELQPTDQPAHCPSCDSTNTVPLSGTGVLCMNCRTEWDRTNPPRAAVSDAEQIDAVRDILDPIPGAHITTADVTVQNVDTLATEVWRRVVMTAAPHTRAEAERIAASELQYELEREWSGDPFVVLAASIVESSLPFADDPAPTDDADDAQGGTATDVGADQPDPIGQLVGHLVELLDGRQGIVRGFPDDDTVTIETRRGRKIDVPIDDVAVDVTLAEQESGAVIELSDSEARTLAATYALGAALAIEAGTAMVDGTGPDATVGVAPTGWLPFDTDESALVEQMAACAVAALVRAFDLPRDDVAMIAATLRVQATPTETEGVTE